MNRGIGRTSRFGLHSRIPAPAPAVLYLDVTSSCKSPMNTGVQRVVRGLQRALADCTAVTPLVWDPALAAYGTLSRRERGFLEDPFGSGPSADAEPGRRANRIPLWSKFARRLAHRRHRLDLPAILTAADTLFVPEIFQDNRIAWLDSLGSRGTAARRVGVCHDALPWSHPEMTPPARLAGFTEYLHALGRFDHIITISRQSAEDLRACWGEQGLPAARQPPVSICEWPVDHGGRLRSIRPAPAPSSSPPGPVVLCVGTFEPRKNHLLLLAAAELAWGRGARFELVLIGRTTTHWGRRVEDEIARAQAAGRAVRWLRHVDDETLRASYEQCGFTVFPSLAEGLGLPILESLWFGRPCICGVNGALGEAASAGGCLAVDQTSGAALAAGLENLLGDRVLYGRLGEEAAGRRFGTWAGLARELLPILRAGDAHP